MTRKIHLEILRLLGVRCAISILGREAGWRLQAVLRPRRFFSRRQTMNLYKSQVMSYLESGVAGYYHAAPSILRAIDRIQERLLREIRISPEDALQWFSLAPLSSRRGIAMLGFLHRIALGEVSLQIAELFPFQAVSADRRPTRLQIRRHARQFVVPVFRTDVLKRSVFGLTVIYNLLPARVVAETTVKTFQSKLQSALRNAASQGLSD